MFHTKVKRDDHMRKHHNSEKLACDLCPKSFLSAKGLAEHKHVHTPTKYKCSKCDKEFNVKSHLMDHIRGHDKPFKCDACDKVFSRKNHLTQHKESVHSRELNACQTCSFTTTSKRALKRHESNHFKASSHLCALCGKGFTRLQYAVSHEKKCVAGHIVVTL